MKIFKFIFLFCLIFIICLSTVNLGINTNNFKPDSGAVTTITNKTSLTDILGLILTIGAVILVGTSLIMGIKFVTSAPEGKAQLKERILMLVIGGGVLFGLRGLLTFILNLTEKSGF